MHCGNEPGMPDCSPIGTVFVSRPRKVGERANDGPPPDLLGADARSHGLAGGGSTTSTQDGMIAECQRANAEPPRQRDTALAPCGSDYADRLTAAVRDGRPGYRCFGWKLVVRQIGPSAARTRRSRTFAGSPPKCRVDKPALSGGEQNAGAAPFDKCPSSGSLRQSLILRSWRRCFQAARRGQSGRCFGQHRASDARWFHRSVASSEAS